MGAHRKITQTQLAPNLSRAYVLRKTHMPAWFKTRDKKDCLLLPRRYSKTRVTLQTLVTPASTFTIKWCPGQVNYHKLPSAFSSMIQGCRAAHRRGRATGICSASREVVRTPLHPYVPPSLATVPSVPSSLSTEPRELSTSWSSNGPEKPICPGEQIMGRTWRIVAEDLGKGGARTTSQYALLGFGGAEGKNRGGTWGALRTGTYGRFLWKTASCIMEPVVSDRGGGVVGVDGGGNGLLPPLVP